MIENRSGKVLNPDGFICNYHKEYYVTDFPIAKGVCKHPKHTGKAKLSEKSVRVATFLEATSIAKENRFIFGWFICDSCRKKFFGKNAENFSALEEEQNFNEIENSLNRSTDEWQMEVDDYSSEEDLEQRNEKRARLERDFEEHEMSPLKFYAKKPNWDDYSITSKKYGERKYNEYMENCSKRFASVYARNDPTGFLDYVKKDRISIELLKEYYDAADSAMGKLSVLTLGDDYSAETLVNYLGCTKFQVAQARKLKICEVPKKKPIKRKRFSKEKVEHFIFYLHEIKALMVAAYGVNNYKYSDGSTCSVPKPVVNGNFL